MQKKLLVYIFLSILVLAGGWFRFQGILEGSFSFTYDVGRDLLAVQDIVSGTKFTLLGPTTGLEGFFYGPWWYYILAIPFFLTGGNPQGIAFFIGLLGIYNIVLGFAIGRKIGGDFLGLMIAAFITFSTPLIGASSQIWSPNLVPTLVLLVILVLHSLFKKPEPKKNWFFLGLLLSLTIETGIIFGILFSISVVLFSLREYLAALRSEPSGSKTCYEDEAVRKELSVGYFAALLRRSSFCFLFIRKTIVRKEALLLILGFVLVELPRILFELRHAFLMTRNILGLSTNFQNYASGDVLARSNYVEIQFVFEKLWSDTVAGENHFIGKLLYVFLFFITFFYYRKAAANEKFLITFSLTTLVVFIFTFVFFSGGLWNHYLVGLPILFILFTCATLNVLKRHFSIRVIVSLLFFGLLLLNIHPFKIAAEFGKPAWEGDAAVYRNQLATIDYVYTEANGRPFKYVLYTPPVHDYTYKYLFSWYGKKKYEKIPDPNATLSYFIIEPDDLYPDRPKDWLKARERDGKIVNQKMLKSGVIVQTREREEGT